MGPTPRTPAANASHRNRRIVIFVVIGAALVVVVVMALVVFGGTKSTTGGASPADRADRAAARSMLLRGPDLPRGWRTAGHQASTARAVGSQLSTCLDASGPALFGNGVTARSAVFSTNNDETQVFDAVEIDRTGGINAALANLQGPGWPTCVNAALQAVDQQALVRGNAVTGSSTAPLNVARQLDPTVATRTTLTIAGRGSPTTGSTLTISVDLVVMRQGPVVELVEFLGTGAVFDANLQQQLVTTLVDRVTASHLG